MTFKFNLDTGEVLDYPIRSAFQNFYPSYAEKHFVSDEQAKVAACISNCKTGRLGYTVSECPECGFKKIRSCSCNNRDCPCCQAPLEKKWVMERNSELIPGIAYYHVVFTLPHELNPLILVNQKALYDLLFSAASTSLIELCRDKKFMGATPGIVSVLHTWGQQLSFHPHLHVCLSGGGLTADGKFIESRHKGFIIPKPVLGSLFRGKFLAGLKRLHGSGRLSFDGDASPLRNSYRWKEFIDRLYSTDWIPFLKETFNGNGNAVEYLARYAYRTAISNSRVEDVSAEGVLLRYTDYADHNEKKLLSLSGDEFIRRFLLHILPKGFHRVRFAGFLANCRKVKQLSHIGNLRRTPYTGNPVRGKRMSEILMLVYGTDICSCPDCHAKMFSYRCSHPPRI